MRAALNEFCAVCTLNGINTKIFAPNMNIIALCHSMELIVLSISALHKHSAWNSITKLFFYSNSNLPPFTAIILQEFYQVPKLLFYQKSNRFKTSHDEHGAWLSVSLILFECITPVVIYYFVMSLLYLGYFKFQT